MSFLVINDYVITFIANLKSYRTIISWVCIASKLWNDSVISNQLYAYLLNVDPKKFNLLEIDILKRLDYDLYVHPHMFQIYEDQINEFSKSQKEFLRKSLDEYYLDKKVLKEYKLLIRYGAKSADSKAMGWTDYNYPVEKRCRQRKQVINNNRNQKATSHYHMSKLEPGFNNGHTVRRCWSQPRCMN